MAIIKPNNNTISAITALPAAISTGKVLQVVTATDTTQRTTTSTSFVTASNTLSVDITPSATSSKILILVSSMIYISQQYKWLEVTIFRGGSNILSSHGGSAIYGGADNGGSVSINYLDSPNSTSQQTYDVRLLTNGSSATAYLNYANSTGSIVALEIGA